MPDSHIIDMREALAANDRRRAEEAREAMAREAMGVGETLAPPTLAARLPLVGQLRMVLAGLEPKPTPDEYESPLWEEYDAMERRADALEAAIRGAIEVLDRG